MTAPRTAEGASRVAKRKAPLGWLPWAALLLAGLIALVALLIARNVGDTGDNPGLDLRDDPAASSQSDRPGIDAETDNDSNSTGQTSGNDSTTVSTAGGSGTNEEGGSTEAAKPPAGQVAAGTDRLLPPPSDGLVSLAGQEAAGTSVRVESVVSDEGFWLGTSKTNRVFLRLDISGESPEHVKAGQKISFNGVVEELTEPASALGVDSSEGAALLKQQGAYVLVKQYRVG